MKKIIYSIIFLFICLHVIPQDSPTGLYLMGPHDGNETYIYTRNDFIGMIPNFSYSPVGQNFLLAQINEEAFITPINYEGEPIVVADRELDYTKAVGTIPGSHSVSLSGAANYQMPLTIPPGINGLQPNISLVYNSQGGNGPLGMGWGLSGFSAITRVPKTIYHEGEIKGVNFDDDRFALDGQRLVDIDDDPLTPYGSNGCQYYTEVFNGSRITSYGSAGAGPEYFIVETKSGLEIEFGNSFGSRIMVEGRDDILLWNVNKITDNFGNYISFIYHQSSSPGTGTEYRIQEIIYGCNENQGVAEENYSRIKFVYGLRDDPSAAFVAGSKISQNVLLKKIKVFSGNDLFRKYELDYHFDFFSHLIKVTETGGNGLSYNSTVFEWKEKDFSFTPGGTFISGFWEYRTGDFAGSGKSEVIAFEYDYDTFFGKYYTGYKIFYDGDPNSVFTEGTFSSTEIRAILTGDYNGDALSDMILVIRKEVGDADDYFYYKWLKKRSGESFIENSHQFPLLSGVPEDEYPFRSYQSADFNGDYQDDIIFNLREEYPTEWVVHNMTNNVDEVDVYLEDHPNRGMKIADFNGDGKTDVMTLHDNGSAIYEYRAPGVYVNYYSSGYPNKDQTVFTGDFNGDGKADVLTWGQSNNWELKYFNDENYPESAWEEIAQWPGDHNSDPSASIYDNNYHVADFNGDGKADILETYINWNGNIGHDATYNIFEFNGSTFNKISKADAYKNTIYTRDQFGDFNGDGMIDMIYSKGPEGHEVFYFYTSGNNDHIIATANGLNQISQFTYLPITNGEVYWRGDPSGSSNGNIKEMRGPLYVTLETTTENGIGGVSQTKYKYKVSKLHRYGKGFLGFAQVRKSTEIITDDPSNSYFLDFTTEYVNPEPYYNLEIKEKRTEIRKITESGSQTTEELNKTSNIQYQYHTDYGDPNGLVFLPYIYSKQTTDELKGVTATNTSILDKWGNLIQSQNSLTGDISNGSYYFDYQAYGSWCLSKPTQTMTVNYRGAMPVFEQRTNYEYFPNTGAIEKIIKDPELGNSLITEYSLYDSYGNPTKVEVSSLDLESRESNTQYDVSGRFIVNATNPLDQATSFVNDPGTGQILSTTDPNGLTFINTIDGLGRLKKEIAPDDNRINHYYLWYSGDDFPNAVYSHRTLSADGSESITHFDILGRKVAAGVKGFNELMVMSESNYNENGKLIATSDSYFEGNSPAFWTNFKYDIYGRIKQTTNLPVTNLTYTYDQLKTTIVDHTTQTISSKTTDASGLLVSATDPGGTIGYTYYSSGNLYKINAPDLAETILLYDEYGRQTELRDPDAGLTEYRYNAYGELVWQKDAENHETNNFYDKLGREDFKTIDGAIIDYEYDTRPHGDGKIAAVSYSNGISYNYYYDGLSRLSKEVETIDDIDYTNLYSYDKFSRLESFTYPSGFELNYTYNHNGYSESILRADNGEAVYTNVNFNHKEQLTDYTLGNELLQTKWVFDDYGYPESVKTGNIQHLEFLFSHQTGNLDVRKDVLRNLEENLSYTDDLKSRLNTWEVDGDVAYSADYYDNGSIDVKSDLGTYNYNTSSQFQPHAVLSIDNPVQLPAEANQTIYYTAFNKVEKIEHDVSGLDLEFTYGPDFSRKKTELLYNENIQETKYFIGGNYEIEIDESGKERYLHYIASDAGLIAIFEIDDGKEQLYYIHKDYLGSIQCISNEKGQAVETLSFDPWGNRRNPNDWSIDYDPQEPLFDRGFTGHQHLDDFHLINMNGRVYDPILAQFLSPDNYVSAPESSQGLNRYIYCYNNPLVYTDPDGQVPWLALGIVAAYTYLSNAHANRDPETGKWAWNPATWFGSNSNTTITAGISTNGNSVTGYGGIGTGNNFPVFGYNNQNGAGVGLWSPEGTTSFYYPSIDYDAGAKAVDPMINSVRNEYTDDWFASSGVVHDLIFDGNMMYLMNAGKVQYCCLAYSGRALEDGSFNYSKSRQTQKGGPIPEGLYYMSGVQSIPIKDKFLGYIGRGAWPGSTYAWGEQRAWIYPIFNTETYGRSDFSIHGGAVPGSAGCIDLVGNNGQFFNSLGGWHLRILKVRY